MLIKTSAVNQHGQPYTKNLVYVSEARTEDKKDTKWLANLAFSPQERQLALNMVMNKFGAYSFYIAFIGLISTLFFLVTGMPFPLLILSSGLLTVGGAGVGRALHFNSRDGRFNKALSQVEDRAKAITINPYDHRANNSYAFNALMETEFGRNHLDRMLFSSFIDSRKDFKSKINAADRGVFSERIRPLLDQYLAETSFLDRELERLSGDISRQTKTDVQARIITLARQTSKQMQQDLEDYQAEQNALVEAKQDANHDYLMTLADQLPILDGWDD